MKGINALITIALLGFFSFSLLAQETSEVVVTNSVQSNVRYISLHGLRVRSGPADNAKTLGLLSLNERVRLIDLGENNDKYTQVEIIKTVNKIVPSDKYFVQKQYLAEKIIDYKEFTGKYFTVLNVATETLRLYERQCSDNTCPHKMIMETEVVVGEDRDLPAAEKGKGRSVLGSYRLSNWVKFYQDPEAHYPAWFREGYPEVPEAGAGFNKWLKKEFMPINAEGKVTGSMRGAFGWYAAFVIPNPYGQWTHGTIGWGEDKDKYIKKTKNLITNIISNPRSSGCTRNNNEAIAFLRQVLDIGAPMIKIYAREALLDSSLNAYNSNNKTWDYILTKKSGEKSDRVEALTSLGISSADADAFWTTKKAGGELIIDPKSPLNLILEIGTYTLDTEPTVIKYTPGEKLGKLERAVGRKGNVYGIHSTDMSSGIFYVDGGLLENYQHPKKILEISGFLDEETPPFMDIKKLSNL